MDKISTEYAIAALVEQALPRFSPSNVGFHVELNASFTLYPKEGQKGSRKKEVRREIHLLFHRPHNYTKVFWFIQDEKKPRFMFREIPQDAWTLKSDHDSCWTSDGLSTPLHSVYFDMREKFPKERIHEINKFVSFGIIHPTLREVNLTRLDDNAFGPRKYQVKIGEKVNQYPCYDENINTMKELLEIAKNTSGVTKEMEVVFSKARSQVEHMESVARLRH